MSQLKSVLLAIELATRQRDDATLALAQMHRNMRFAQAQMEQLEAYAADTDARWTGARPGALSAELIRHHYQFMNRLQQAIALQTTSVGDVAAQLDSAGKVLLQAELRLAGLKQVLERRQRVVAMSHKRRDQRHTDEFAALVYSRHKLQSVQGEPG